MSGVEDEVDRVAIPSVFVSHSTGTTLKNHTEDNDEVLITLNGTGHVKPKTKQIGKSRDRGGKNPGALWSFLFHNIGYSLCFTE